MLDTKQDHSSGAGRAATVNPIRRNILIGFAVVATQAMLGAPRLSHAAISAPLADLVPDPGFYALCQHLTGHLDLNPETAARMHAALPMAQVPNAQRLGELVAVKSASTDPESVLEAANAAGLKDLALAIVEAWYTGTVGHGPHAILLAYQEALMYRPVRDGLTVPTYCNFGPLWWTGHPPDVAQLPADGPSTEASV